MRIEPRRVLQLLVGALALLSLTFAASGTDLFAQDEEPDGLEALKEERERIAREAAQSVSEIDIHTATVDQVSAALDEISAFVEIQEARLEDAQGQYDSALASIEQAENEREELLIAAEVLRDHIADLAVSSFTGESGTGEEDVTELIMSDDPGESARFVHLLELHTGNLGDSIDRLRVLEFEAAELIDVRNVAAARAAESLAEVEERSAELQEALERQQLILQSAEVRLEAQLAEAAFLQERDFELSTLIREEQIEINNQIIAAAQARGIEIPEPVDLNDIVLISFYRPGEEPELVVNPETGVETQGVAEEGIEPFFQIEVHRDIEQQTRALYELAYSQGIDLGGWGYRPIQRQVELRAAHCGGSSDDIWLKPAFACNPPTARPGFSKHEQGRAIDFQWNGGSIGPRGGEPFRWLAANAPQFGFVNLPSEPWHWSIDEGAERLPGSS